MYRIKLATGTILEFDSIEALTADIHAGVVDAEALIFHQRANQWLPIHVHPAWKQALAAIERSGHSVPSSTTKAAAAVEPKTATRAAAPAPTAAPTRPTTAGAPVAKAATGPAVRTSKAAAGTKSSVPTAAETLSVPGDLAATLGLDLLDMDAPPAVRPAAPVPKTAPTNGPAKTAAPVKSAPAPAPTRAASSAKPADGVSVDHLDEELELLAPEEVAVPPAPAPAASSVAEKASNAEPLAGPVAPKTPPIAVPLVPVLAAETLVPSERLVVEPVIEEVKLQPRADEASLPITSDVASEVTMDLAAHAAPATAPADASGPASVAGGPAAPALVIERAPVLEFTPAVVPAPAAEAAPTASSAPVQAEASPIVPPAFETLAPMPVSEWAPPVSSTPAVTSSAPIEAQAIAPIDTATPTTDAAAAESETSAGPSTPALADISPTVVSHRSRRLPVVWIAAGAAAAGVALAAVMMRGGSEAKAETPKAESIKRVADAGVPAAPLVLPPESFEQPTAESAKTEKPSREEAKAATVKPEGAPAKPAADAAEGKAARAPKDAKEKPAAEPEVIAAPTDFRALDVPTTVTVKLDIGPSVLAGRYAAAHDAAWNDLVAKLRVAGFDQLFAPSRVASTSAANSKASVAAARAHIAAWRSRVAIIEKAYRDSSAVLGQSGAWNASEQKDWESRPKRGESGESAQQANAVLNAADRIFGILAANARSYEITNGTLKFTDSGAQRDYWEARRALVAALGDAGSADGRVPLALVLKAVGSTRPPEGVTAN